MKMITLVLPWKRQILRFSFLFLAFSPGIYTTGCRESAERGTGINAHIRATSDDLRFSVYATAHTINRVLSTETGRLEALAMLRLNGIGKIYLEVYRSGLVVDPEILQSLRDYFHEAGIETAAGIATVPGGDFGVRQEGPLGWFNWQNEKTQRDIKAVVETTAGIFDHYIVDDFLCTGDTSKESKAAKSDRSWSEYRRSLLTRLSTELFIDPAKRLNPDINMTIKYPQWYDRFHIFGYDVSTQPALFDQVWVGTETRGQYTQRFGFVQPYEGFVNYRWIATFAGDKIGGAWFDHGDCDPIDFLEQAYQSVLAGAPEIIIFNYNNFLTGHRGHHLLRHHVDHLAALANAVAEHPVSGIPAYKPANSDAGGDLYIMDYMGMLGIPIIPVSAFPKDAHVIFLPTQAAADPDIAVKVQQAADNGAHIVMTTGFLSNTPQKERMRALAGIDVPEAQDAFEAHQIISEGSQVSLPIPLQLESSIVPENARILLEAVYKGKKTPYFCVNSQGNVYTLNVHTFSQADFEAVGEVLLSPKQLGLLEIPEAWCNTIRSAFGTTKGWGLEAPSRIVIQPLGDGSAVVHNYNREARRAVLLTPGETTYIDAFDSTIYNPVDQRVNIDIPARSRIWMRPGG